MRSSIEEYKDGEIHVFENTIINHTDIILKKDWVDENGIPVKKEGSVSFLLETWEKPLTASAFEKTGETVFVLTGHDGIYEKTINDLPLYDSQKDYRYRIKEISEPGYEVLYSHNDATYTLAQWENTEESFISEGTIIVTNREKKTEYQLPSTGGPGIPGFGGIAGIGLSLLACLSGARANHNNQKSQESLKNRKGRKRHKSRKRRKEESGPDVSRFTAEKTETLRTYHSRIISNPKDIALPLRFMIPIIGQIKHDWVHIEPAAEESTLSISFPARSPPGPFVFYSIHNPVKMKG